MSKITIPDEAHDFISDYYRPARCVNCGERREHLMHQTPTTITIPPEAVEAHAQSLASHGIWAGLWDVMSETQRNVFRARSRAACLAMLQAWPEMGIKDLDDNTMAPSLALILPLTQEPAPTPSAADPSSS
jgi:hypothetical protein